jgi:two-component system, OmpR family, phosphate regulon sensor histidine kinase PhoR
VDEQTSELRAKTKHLEKLLKMRSEFLNIASHQLRTPVSVILGTISMFKEGSIDKLPPEKQKQFIDNIYYKSRKLEQIIRDILLASEIDSGHFSLGEERLAVVDVVSLVAEVVKANSTKAQDKDLELVFNKPSEELKIKAHADYLKQALAYVIDNALIYTPAGQVTVDLTEDKGRVVIKVSDTGIGIPAEDQDKIFKKFARGRQAVDLYTDGSGLGLFIVLKITEAQPGGQISFESEAGQGSIFILSFPLVQ